MPSSPILPSSWASSRAPGSSPRSYQSPTNGSTLSVQKLRTVSLTASSSSLNKASMPAGSRGSSRGRVTVVVVIAMGSALSARSGRMRQRPGARARQPVSDVIVVLAQPGRRGGRGSRRASVRDRVPHLRHGAVAEVEQRAEAELLGAGDGGADVIDLPGRHADGG